MADPRLKQKISAGQFIVAPGVFDSPPDPRLTRAFLVDPRHHLAVAIDEGMVIAEGMIPGLRPAAAIIGVAEKGYMSALLKVTATPGHSSMPPPAGSSAIATAAFRRSSTARWPTGAGSAFACPPNTAARDWGWWRRRR